MNSPILLPGDCLDLMCLIPDGSVDMVLADLPFGTTKCPWDVVIPFAPLWEQYNRITKKNAAILLFSQQPFTSVAVNSNIENFRYDWVWEKTHATGHLNAKRMPMKAHESMLVFYRKLPTFNPQMTGGHARKTATKRVDDSRVYGAQQFDELVYDSTDRYPRSVLLFPSDKQRLNLHPTQKPVALCEYAIRTYSNEGETVLDNTMGSGTTGVAARNTGRKFIGIERDPADFKTATDRILGTTL